MTEEELRGYQESIRYATEALCGEKDDTFLHRRCKNECEFCGRPTYNNSGICDACRLGPI